MSNGQTCFPSTSISAMQFSKTVGTQTSGNWSLLKTISRHVFPHAPSPTITSFFRMAAISVGRQEEQFLQEFVKNKLSKKRINLDTESQFFCHKDTFFGIVGHFTCDAIVTCQGTQSHFVICLFLCPPDISIIWITRHSMNTISGTTSKSSKSSDTVSCYT